MHSGRLISMSLNRLSCAGQRSNMLLVRTCFTHFTLAHPISSCQDFPGIVTTWKAFLDVLGSFAARFHGTRKRQKLCTMWGSATEKAPEALHHGGVQHRKGARR